MLYLALPIALTAIIFSLAVLLWSPEPNKAATPHAANQREQLEHEAVLSAIYLVQGTPSLGPPPPVARLEPEQNRFHIDDC